MGNGCWVGPCGNFKVDWKLPFIEWAIRVSWFTFIRRPSPLLVKNGSGPARQAGRRGKERRTRLASAFPLQAPASRRRRGGNATGRGGREMAKSCKGLAMELVKCLSETDCVKVGRLLPPFSSSTHAQLAAACSDPIGC